MDRKPLVDIGLTTPGNRPLDGRRRGRTLAPFFGTKRFVVGAETLLHSRRSLLPTMNRMTKLFLHVYPSVLSAPTAVQYYDLTKVEVPAATAETEATSVNRGKNAKNWTRAVNRLVQNSLWRKTERSDIAA